MIAPKNILIVRTDRIGDVVLSLPLAELIKKHYPECKVSFLVRNYTKDILFNHPSIDNVLILNEKNNKILLGENAKHLKNFNFDSTIVVYPTFWIAYLIFLSRIPQRIGTGYRWYSFLFNTKIYVHRKYAEKHELEFNIDLLKPFGINEQLNEQDVQFNIQINPTSEQKIKEMLKESGINSDDFIAILHPGSGGSSVNLPIEKFKKIIELISKNDKIKIFLTGSKEETKICEMLKMNENIKNLAGKLNLSELIALTNMSNIFISNSTGPLHIAAALGKNTIGFYPRILACSAKRWGPYTNKKKIFEPSINCENCTREQCSKLDCMNSIEPREVAEEIDRVFNLTFNKRSSS